jgi:hypothetical protein
MFNSGMQESNSTTVIMTDFSLRAVREFVRYIYTDEYIIEYDNEIITDKIDLLRIAHKYDIKQLISHVNSDIYSDISIDNVFEVISICNKYKEICKDINEMAIMYLADTISHNIINSNMQDLFEGEELETRFEYHTIKKGNLYSTYIDSQIELDNNEIVNISPENAKKILITLINNT